MFFFAVVMAATAWLAPSLLPGLVATVLVLGTAALACRYLIAAWVIWLLVASLSLEMALNDLFGPTAFQPAIAAVKGAEICLVALTIILLGVTGDRFNPAWGFAGIAVISAVVGTLPELTPVDFLRSLIGSITPFLVFFCVKPAGWGNAVQRAVMFAPTLAIVSAAMLDVAGLRPMFVDSGGLRLAGLGHPAFLAGVCLPAIYAGLLRWLRSGSPRAAIVLAVNLIILLLTGARAPAAYAAIVIAGSLIFAPGAAVPRRQRLALVAAALIAGPILLFIGESYSSLRLFEMLAGEAGHLSGRDLLWPEFEAAAARAPWFGWGPGAGNFIIPHDGVLAQFLGTWAAHNEYLRILVEGGQVGRTLLILLFVLWVATHTRRLPPLERFVMRLIFLAYAAHAVTDNVLISTPACVFFAFVAAVFSQAGETASNRLRHASDVA